MKKLNCLIYSTFGSEDNFLRGHVPGSVILLNSWSMLDPPNTIEGLFHYEYSFGKILGFQRFRSSRFYIYLIHLVWNRCCTKPPIWHNLTILQSRAKKLGRPKPFIIKSSLGCISEGGWKFNLRNRGLAFNINLFIIKTLISCLLSHFAASPAPS